MATGTEDEVYERLYGRHPTTSAPTANGAHPAEPGQRAPGPSRLPTTFPSAGLFRTLAAGLLVLCAVLAIAIGSGPKHAVRARPAVTHPRPQPIVQQTAPAVHHAQRPRAHPAKVPAITTNAATSPITATRGSTPASPESARRPPPTSKHADSPPPPPPPKNPLGASPRRGSSQGTLTDQSGGTPAPRSGGPSGGRKGGARTRP